MRLTRITSDSGRLTKEINLRPDGTLSKKGATYLTNGKAERMSVESFSELESIIRSLESNQAIIHADYKHDADAVSVVTKDNVNGGDEIARTKDYFFFPRAETSISFDYDGGAPITAHDWLAQMVTVWPGFDGAGYVHAPSSSGGLKKSGRPLESSTGMRMIFGVRDASDVPRFAISLFDRAWLAGLGEIHISKAGTMSERVSLFDAAVFSPERLDYLAAPVITSDALSRDVSPTVVEGSLIDTRACDDLSEAEERQAETMKAAARKSKQSEADHIRQAYISDQADKLGVARRVIESRIEFRLLGSDVLKFDRGSEITVADVLLDPASFEGETLADPIEPEKGKNKARVYFNRPQNEVRIFSHIHGGQEYVLRFDFDTLAKAYEKLDDADQFAELFNRAELTPIEAERFKSIVAKKTALSKKVINDEINFTGHARRAMTHGEMAQAWLDSRGAPVFDDGDFWEPDDLGIWQRIEPETVRREISERFKGEPGCKSHSQYKQISEAAADIAHRPEFFESAPTGVAAPSGFYRLADDKIEREPLSADHRQRFMLPADPEKGSPTMLLDFLGDCFDERDSDHPYDAHGNKLAMQEIFGAILFGTATKYERAFLLKGLGNSGKSTMLRILEALISDRFICSVKPHIWGSDYHAAALAGMLLNDVGETGEHKLGDAFKEVLGRDRISGRNPYGRVFSFRCPAAHVFNANEFPPTRYRDVSFWRRWLIVPFFNSRADDDASNVRDLDDQILSNELPQIVAWAMTGAERVEKQNGFTEPTTHKELLRAWELDADSVAAWLDDDEAVTVGDECSQKRGEVYANYRSWCSHNGRRALGRNRFFDSLVGHGFDARKSSGTWIIDGLASHESFQSSW